jgi:hypothetical protein
LYRSAAAHSAPENLMDLIHSFSVENQELLKGMAIKQSVGETACEEKLKHVTDVESKKMRDDVVNNMTAEEMNCCSEARV